MTKHHKAVIEQLDKVAIVKRLNLKDIHTLTPDDIPELIAKLAQLDFPASRQFSSALFLPLQQRMIELTGDPKQGCDTARRMNWLVEQAIKGNMQAIDGFLLQLDPMHTTAEQERAAIEHLKPGYEPAWFQLIEALTPPVYRKLHQVTGGDEEKVLDYVGEIFALVVRALDKVEVDMK